MQLKAITLMFIGYLFLLAPFGRIVQAWVEQIIGARSAIAITVICLVALNIRSPTFTRQLVIDLFLKTLLATAACAAISPLILYPVEWSHILHYAILSILLLNAFKISSSFAVFIAVLIGLTDETLQGLSPNRVFDLKDILLNILGAGVGLSVYHLSGESLRAVTRRRRTRPHR